MLGIDDSVEVVSCVAKDKKSVKNVLIKLFELVERTGLAQEDQDAIV